MSLKNRAKDGMPKLSASEVRRLLAVEEDNQKLRRLLAVSDKKQKEKDVIIKALQKKLSRILQLI